MENVLSASSWLLFVHIYDVRIMIYQINDVVLQLPPPQPNPILVAFGNVSVSRTLKSIINLNVLFLGCRLLKSVSVPLSAVPLRFRRHKEGQIEVRRDQTHLMFHSDFKANHRLQRSVYIN